MAFLATVLIVIIVISTLSNCEHADDTSRNICTTMCLQENLPSQEQQHCNDKCKRNRIKRNNQNRNMTLICRDDTTLVVEIEIGIDNADVLDKTGVAFLVNIEQIDEANLPPKTVHLLKKPLARLENLKANTRYNISATLLNQHFRYLVDKTFMEFQTLEVNYVPGNVTNIYTEDFSLSSDGTGLDVAILWDPSDDRTCSYELLFHSRDSDYDDETFTHRELNEPDELYRHQLTDLNFEMEYAIGVRAFNTKNRTLHSSIWWHIIKTPSCLEWFQNNLTACAPYQPENITVKADYMSENRYKLNISWDNPPEHPDYYTIDIIDYESGFRQIFNVSDGTSNSVQFENVEISGLHFELTLTAHSSGGESSTIYRGNLDISLYPQSFDDYFTVKIAALTITASLLGIAVLVAIKLKLNHRSKSIQAQNRDNCFIDLELKSPNEPTIYDNDIRNNIHSDQIYTLQFEFSFVNDKMEIEPDQISILEIIGEGAFGCVWRATLRTDERNVAVKMLKNGPSYADVRNFCREIEVMKSVPEHPHIVGIVGHCTKNIFALMLLTEYCSEGNLLDFLRKIWKQQSMDTAGKGFCFSPISLKHKSPESAFDFDTSLTEKHSITYKKIHNGILSPTTKFLTPEKTKNFHIADTSLSSSQMIAVENHGYGFDIGNNQIESPVTHKNLISFARQIANGMNYLSLNKVVHRDLACRNILVCADRATVKISDFGLSRDIYQENLYKKSGSGMLPIKWLAIESLTHQLYTSQSDVWSFGVLLYEIVTGGSVPYPSVETKDILSFLKAGGRMDRPDECRTDIYQLMQMCWNEVPSERPTFMTIEDKLNAILNDMILT